VTGSGEKILSAKSEDTLVSPSHRGKQIFEKMYAYLFEECKKQNIRLIWGFTYADKPFKKLGFEVPYKACMGILTQEVFKATAYFNALSVNRRFKEKLSILALSLFSKCKAILKLSGSGQLPELKTGSLEFSGPELNYIHAEHQFGLLLDADFLNYRIHNNPYGAVYNTLSHSQNGQLEIAITYSISEQGVCYMVHLYLSPNTSANELRRFFRSFLKTREIQNSKVIRFWGFRHNSQNKKEVELLSACGFTFINKGICTVWKSLDETLKLKPKDFVLSRMASQGTDE
jgi:hypothetical protein